VPRAQRQEEGTARPLPPVDEDVARAIDRVLRKAGRPMRQFELHLRCPGTLQQIEEAADWLVEQGKARKVRKGMGPCLPARDSTRALFGGRQARGRVRASLLRWLVREDGRPQACSASLNGRDAGAGRPLLPVEELSEVVFAIPKGRGFQRELVGCHDQGFDRGLEQGMGKGRVCIALSGLYLRG
jgi:hypothetical protein